MILPVASVKIWIDEIDARTIDTPSIATAVRLMFGLGLRESEATGARWEWLDWGRQTYTPGKTKGRESEPIPVPEWLINHLQQTRADSGLIAPRADGAAHPSGFAREAMRAANKVCGTKGLTPHRLRGTFATLLSEAGVPIQMIQAVMRHKSPLTTMGYLEKNLVSATMGQARIAQQIGFSRQENGKRTHANPHEQRASE
jgi:integrase